MERRPLTILIAALLATVAIAGAALAPRLGSARVPTTFDLDFRAFGYVESVEELRGGCRVQIAVYEWVNLSPGFELAEIPQQDDRYRLTGATEHCQALTVAMAATGQHIGFEAGRVGARWYLSDRPFAAFGCGGLEIDWTPAPRG